MLITQPGGVRVKVVDFGIAKVISETSDSPVSKAMGTPQYASPEQFHVGEQLNERSDIYSLGVMVYQMLTGRCPFEAGSIHELMRLKLQETPLPLRQLCPKAPVAVEQLVSGMLARNPAQRPKSAGEVATLFRHALESPEAAEASISDAATVVVPSELPTQRARTHHTVNDQSACRIHYWGGGSDHLNTNRTSTNRSCVLVLSFAAAVIIAIPASFSFFAIDRGSVDPGCRGPVQ
jgi:serine/threonine protein kinase